MTETEKLVTKWHGLFKQATDFDSWGQLVEAVDQYNKLAKQMRTKLTTFAWTEDQKKNISTIAACLECRAKMLQSVSGNEELSLKDVRKLDPCLKSLSGASVHNIPKDLTAQVERVRRRHAITTPSPEPAQAEDEEDVQLFTSKINPLLPKLPLRPGTSLVTVNIVKIGLKDANDCVDPFFVVSCKDKSGIDKCRTQNTPCPTSKDSTYLYYNVNVELQMHLEQLHKNVAVFFEMMHYKTNRRRNVTKCFAFMEVDELKSGPCVIELYKKPIDYRRKKLTLLTSKPLYLHLALTITSE